MADSGALANHQVSPLEMTSLDYPIIQNTGDGDPRRLESAGGDDGFWKEADSSQHLRYETQSTQKETKANQHTSRAKSVGHVGIVGSQSSAAASAGGRDVAGGPLIATASNQENSSIL